MIFPFVLGYRVDYSAVECICAAELEFTLGGLLDLCLSGLYDYLLAIKQAIQCTFCLLLSIQHIFSVESHNALDDNHSHIKAKAHCGMNKHLGLLDAAG